MNERQLLQIKKNKQQERAKKLRDKRYKTDAELQEEVLNEAKRILGLL